MRFFGTDGVRGTVGEHPMTAEFALRLAGAAARALLPRGGKVVIGKDTRVSGYMFESALEAGFVAAGADVRLSGPLPTPGVALLTRELDADLGVVISASHNAYCDNGIKFFKHDGFKLATEEEALIESHIDDATVTLDSTALGQVRRVDDALERYEKHCLETVPDGMSLEGVKIVVDCAHGASYRVAPATLTALGAELVPLGCSPNGRNINDRCGATEPDLLRRTVQAVEADVGIALDGDGDRVIMVDSRGETLNGDTLLLILARARKEAGRLSGPVVGTEISGMALERALAAEDISFLRAEVGDPSGRQHASRSRWRPGRREFRSPSLPGQVHYRRRADRGTGSIGRHARQAVSPVRPGRGHAAYGAGQPERALPTEQARWRIPRSRWPCVPGASCSAPMAG